MVPCGAAFADIVLTSPRSEVRRALSEVATAVEFLHAVDWAHRDIKPGNVIMDSGRAVLIDYGESAKEGELCQPWTTPMYAAPELPRAMGRSEQIRATKYHDRYSFGSTVLASLQGNHRQRGERFRSVVLRAWAEPPYEQIGPQQVVELLEEQ